jgi:hypothetical protein
MTQNKEDFDLEYSTIPDNERLDTLAEVWAIEGETQEERRDKVLKHPDILRDEWNRANELITGIIQEELGERVEVKASNLGWRNAPGKTLELEAEEVVDEITDISGDFSLYVKVRDSEEVTIKRTDHDSPTISQANTFRVRSRNRTQ